MWLAVVLFLLLARPVMAQPADCATAPPTGPVASLAIDLAGRHGVPKGVGGQATINVPMGAPAGAACHDDPPPPPRDVLHGAPGDLLDGRPGEESDGTPASVPPADVLSGPPSPDLLRDPGHPHVKVEFR